MHRTRIHAIAWALALLVASGSTLALLLAARPHIVASVVTGSGDDLAFVAAWMFGVASTLWLTLTTLACIVALVHGGAGPATRIARLGPPVARRLLQTALVGTFAVMPAAAYTTPSAPIVLHAGPGGRLTAVPGDPPNDMPVVRTPPPATTAPTSTTTITTAPVVTVPTRTAPTAVGVAIPPPAPLPVVRAPVVAAVPTTRAHPAEPASDRARSLAVRAGDNLWRIARAEAARVAGVARPDDHTIATYWQRVVAANRSTLRSGDPNLIFPGEVIRLPRFER